MKKLPEGAYIPLARRLLSLTEKETATHFAIHETKRQCATAMHAVSMTEFVFGMNGHDYRAKLERRLDQRIHTRKLYTLLASGEITIDEFLDCITAPIKAVEETLGEDRAKLLMEDYRRGLDITIEAV